MQLIDEGKPSSPNIMSVDAGEVFAGGRYHSLVPILKEEYSVSGQVISDSLCWVSSHFKDNPMTPRISFVPQGLLPLRGRDQEERRSNVRRRDPRRPQGQEGLLCKGEININIFCM